VRIGVIVNGPIAIGPERLSHVSNVRASGRRVTSPVTAISLADPDFVHIGQLGGSSSTSPQWSWCGWLMRTVAGRVRSSDAGTRPVAPSGAVERAPGVEDETVAVRVRDLDAAPADLLSAAVDRKG
jgi:hypothetical protein